MKKSSLFLKSLLFSLLGIICIFPGYTQEIPNPGFETWINEGSGAPAGAQRPANWYTLNQTILFLFPFTTTTKNTDAHTGSFSAELSMMTKTVPGVGTVTMPGMLSTAKVTLDLVGQSFSATGGWPFTGTPSKLTGYYKYQPDNGDSCLIGVALSRWHDGSRDTLAIGGIASTTVQSDWTLFEVPIEYLMTETPDTMNIVILNSVPALPSTHLNTKMWVDDLAFDYSGVGVEMKPVKNNLAVYADGNTKKLILDCKFEKATPCSFRLYNLKGNCVSEFEKTILTGTEYIDISQLPYGVYILKVTSGNQVLDTRKISIHS